MLNALSMAVMLVQMCVSHPDNIKACLTDQHVWLWPEVQRGLDLYLGHEQPYSTEPGG